MTGADAFGGLMGRYGDPVPLGSDYCGRSQGCWSAPPSSHDGEQQQSS